jgi:DNA-binding winged helix-turn-helix (wHTH) protein/Tol biopolymer transport system component
MKTAENTTISFGEFELDPLHKRLLKRGRPVTLKPKAIDLLLVLVESRGEVVTKSDLLDRVWVNQFVEENNLSVHVAALRKALGETKNDHSYIVTVPGTGYKFVAELKKQNEIVVEQHSFEHVVYEEEIEVESGEQDLMHRGGSKFDRDGNARQSAAEPFIGSKTFLKKFTEHRVAAILLIATIAAGLIGAGYFFGPRLSGGFASVVPFAQHTVRQLTTNGKVGLAALSPDGKMFAYTIDDLGQKSLWLGYVSGGNHLLLRTPSEATYSTITFSKDNKDLYYSIRDDQNPNSALYKMPAFGGVQTKIMDDISNFSISPDGRSIALGRRDKNLGKDFVVIAGLDGAKTDEIASFPQDRSFRFDTISWSMDGKRLAMSAKTDSEIASDEIAVLDIASRRLTQIPHKTLREITKTAWLRDDSGLIVTAIEPESDSSVPQYVLYLIEYPSGEIRPITSDRSNYGASWHNDSGVSISLSDASDALLAVEHRQLSNVWVAPSDDLNGARQITFGSFGKYDGLWGMDWTPDGRLIYTTSDTQSQFLAQMNADGSDQIQITAPTGYDSVLSVTHDGRYIVFHSDRNSTIDIWRTDIDGTNPLQLTFGGKGFHPAPSPDGRWVYYRSRLNGDGWLCRVPIDGGEPEVLNNNDTAWMSFSPDGKYFAASHVTDKRRLALFSAETNQLLKQFDLPKTGTLYMGTRWTPDSQAVTYRDNSFGYWIQPISGGEPQKLDGLPVEKLYNFSWSKDGKWFAFVRGQEIRDVVLLRSGP